MNVMQPCNINVYCTFVSPDSNPVLLLLSCNCQLFCSNKLLMGEVVSFLFYKGGSSQQWSGLKYSRIPCKVKLHS